MAKAQLRSAWADSRDFVRRHPLVVLFLLFSAISLGMTLVTSGFAAGWMGKSLYGYQRSTPQYRAHEALDTVLKTAFVSSQLPPLFGLFCALWSLTSPSVLLCVGRRWSLRLLVLLAQPPHPGRLPLPHGHTLSHTAHTQPSLPPRRGPLHADRSLTLHRSASCLCCAVQHTKGRVFGGSSSGDYSQSSSSSLADYLKVVPNLTPSPPHDGREEWWAHAVASPHCPLGAELLWPSV